MCAICHGDHGEGYRADHAPALSQPDFLASVSDEALAVAIADGRPGTTMSAWSVRRGGPLADGDILELLDFLRTWQTRPSARLDERTPHGDAKRGQRLFERECNACHGEGAPYVKLEQREWLANNGPGFLRHALQTGRPPTAMPSFAVQLRESDREDVVTYLRALPAWPTPDAPPPTMRPPPLPLGPVPLNPRGKEPREFVAYPRMTSADVIQANLREGARMVLLDARVPSDYATVHIAGAVSVPFYDPTPYLDKLPRDSWLVCYCGCPHAESGALAEQLVRAGFRRVTVLDEGLGYWLDKGYPARSGSEP